MKINRTILIMCIAYFILSTLNQCTVKQVISKSAADRVINFSGYTWIVRDTHDRTSGPGPNLFSNSEKNVWVDKNGKLHLSIVKRKGKWYCAEVTLDKKVGYGKYIFYINSSLSSLEEHIIAGLFTYLNDNEEIDIEFSRWSIHDNQNAQYVVQPHDNPENIYRFNVDDSTGNTVHSFEWLKEKIIFESYYGNLLSGEKAQSWTYKGNDIPKQSDERLKINLWLYQGRSPQENKTHELVIDSVRFVPFNQEPF